MALLLTFNRFVQFALLNILCLSQGILCLMLDFSIDLIFSICYTILNILHIDGIILCFQ